ncbi:hypothetical protein A3F00_02895 [Candidatus Daviesbacteria bacterium RIFCSPHIGHO2_12_FULL_37_11]|uniref:Glycosyl transferase family 1 domain-containing protein n=1 Tax=Candidatus Daviesbacteria bacterium RIFCSPHIGHO2_12_FULL_37_11 TaxID=1797777 RepID=A0A1F5KBC9_9BACT|nr:MAG: hypothetical protein A2769_04185 [Candidatus Daviesbacteria bacterium RIFCSPHIGHO2_01_FULL_37_27]OGE38247.1 MAG: hypothetical protein A3F00_02895 [Candidatus Daviesbacteria bacterium RIFCSPHIGHO2_12_FULL_37_11]OGE46204.1 MAG: hypothetical protein A3B39_02660 [Candidatus Daviesbacteria bacterium RIFCSPLOWO2_01_FULL_37_10]
MTNKINSVFFATFSIRSNNERTSTNGMIEPIESFFVPKLKRFMLLEQPHPGSDTVIPILENYKNGKLKKKSHFFLTSYLLLPLLKLSNLNKTQIIFKVRDFLSIFELILRNRQKYDLFIGLESINALAGIILRRLKVVNRVVYYVSDYSPNRYKVAWFNKLYLSLDRFAAINCDFIWDVSKAMMPARIKAGLDPKKTALLIHVPNALYKKQIKYLPVSKIIPNSLVYVGTLGKINGPDIAIRALTEVLKTLPNVTLHIYGDGEPDISRIKNLSNKLKLTGKVVFHGFISDQVELSKQTSQYAIALAPYLETPGSPRWWADATKIRLYLAAGLPVITTKVPPLGRDVEQDGAAIITGDNPKEFAKTITSLLKNKIIYNAMKKNAIKRAKGNTWENTYSSAISKMSIDLS